MRETPSNRVIDFKGSALNIINASLRDADPVRLADALHTVLGGMPDFFSNEPVVLDFSDIDAMPERVDWAGLIGLLRRYQLQPVGVRRLPVDYHDGAKRVGLAILHDNGISKASKSLEVSGRTSGAIASQPAVASQNTVPVNTAVTQQPAAPAPAPAPAAPAAQAAPAQQPQAAQAFNGERVPTMFIDRTLRSGQQVYAKGGDLVIMGMVSHGAEVIADGSIHCYGPLRGRALAGARGDANARIFTTDFGPELVSVAGIYRTFEKGIPSDVAGKPAQIKSINDTLLIEQIK